MSHHPEMSSSVGRKKGDRTSSPTPGKFSVGVKIKLLKNNFPELSDATCEDLLSNCKWSVEDAKNYLSNNKVRQRDDRTYTPRQSREFDRFEFADWPTVIPNGAVGTILNNGGYQTYPPAASTSAPRLAATNSLPLVKPHAGQPRESREGLVANFPYSNEDSLNPSFDSMNLDANRNDAGSLAGASGTAKETISTYSGLMTNSMTGHSFVPVAIDSRRKFGNVNWERVEQNNTSGEIDLIHFDEGVRMKEGIPERTETKHMATGAAKHLTNDKLLKFESDEGIKFMSDTFEPTGAAARAKRLHSMFPNITLEVVDDVISNCKGDLNWALEILLDWERNSRRMDFADKTFAPLSPHFQSNLGSGSRSRSRSTSDTENEKRESVGASISMISYFNDNISKSCKDILPTANEHVSTHNEDTCSANGNSTFNGDLSDDGELFVSTDGEDWFDMQLDANLVRNLTQAFQGCKPSLDELDPASLKIRISPKVAFEIFQYYYLGLMEKSTSVEERNPTFDETSDPIVKDLAEMDAITASAAPDLKKLMEIEARLSARDRRDLDEVRSSIPPSMACKLAIDELQSNFPKLKRSEIETVYAMSGYSHKKTMERLTATYPDKKKNEAPGAGYVKDTASGNATQNASANSPNQSAVELRQTAYWHHRMRVYYASQLGSCSQKLAGVHYSERVHYHTMKMQEFNSKAADVILQEYQKRHGNSNDIDLHELYVHEALKRLRDHLEEKRQILSSKGMQKMDLRIITGRGNHSKNGEGKLAPAVKNFLRSQHYSFWDCNGFILVHLRSH